MADDAPPWIPPALAAAPTLPTLLAEARAAHAAPPRAYHGWPHVRRVLAHAGAVAAAPGWDHPAEAFLAAVFHDAVYVAGARDNEARSAALARAAIARHLPGQADADRVAATIEATARHGALAPGDVDRDTALLLDCDTAVLGAPADEFDRYDAGIAEEWAAVVEPAAYRAGRRAFLARLLAAPRIFLSPELHARLDAPARANLARALARLS